MKMLRLILILVPVCLFSRTGLAQSKTPQRLASEFARAATLRVAVEPLTINAIEMATILMEEALRLDPENPETWQSVLNLAMLAENEPLRDRAVENLLRLDPQHESARLIRLSTALERHQTFESRIASYEKLLVDENVPRLGPAVASRLALDSALLHQRQGNVEQFSRWLTKSVTWDSSNRAAAAIAAGFFSINVDDPVAETELLVNLLLADPTDSGTHVELGQKLLEHGAFTGAERMYQLAIRCLIADGKEVMNSLVIDQVLSQWAAGKVEEALAGAERRQNDLDLSYRLYVQRERPELTLDQLKALDCPVDQNLAMVDAVIRASHNSDDAAVRIERALKAFQGSIDIAKEMASLPESERRGYNASPTSIAQDYLNMVWLAVWTGVGTDRVEAWLEAAEGTQALAEEAKERIRGWLSLHRGEIDQAISSLTPLAATDPAAHLGLAHAHMAQGHRADAAREFLSIVRQQPGSMIGIWAAERFKALVGSPVPPTPNAVALEHLMASISMQFDRYTDDPSLAILLRITPTKSTYEAFTPIEYTIELTNNSPYPLALDRNGPLRPQLLVMCTVRSPLLGGTGDLRPFVIDLSRRLRLAPRQRLTIRIDLRDHWPGTVINTHALDGAIVRLRVQMNFGVNETGSAVIRLYGQEVDAPLIRVDGIRMPETWIATSAEQLKTLSGDPLLEHMAMMSHRVAARPAQPPPPEERDLLYAARLAMAEVFGSLDGLSQAWVLAVMERGVGLAVEGLGPIHAIARKSEDRLVIICNMLFHAVGGRDPVFEAAKRHEDPVVRRLAELFEQDALEMEQAGSATQP